MAAPINFAIVLDIYSHGENVSPESHDPAATYAQIVATWRSVKPVPSLATLQGLWNTYLAANPSYGSTGAQLDMATVNASIDAPSGIVRAIVAKARLDYADQFANVPWFAAKYPTLAAYVTAIKTQVNAT